MNEYIQASGSDVLHLIAEVVDERTAVSVCGLAVSGARASIEDGRLCTKCEARSS